MGWLNDFAKVTHISPGSKAIAKGIGLIKDKPAEANTSGQLDINQILQSIYGPEATNLQLGNLNTMLRGNFDAGKFSAANQDIASQYQSMMDSGELNSGWTLEDFAKANGKDPNQYYGGGLIDLTSQASAAATGDQTTANSALRTSNIKDLATLGPQAQAAWAAANPEYANFTKGMLGQLNDLNGRAAPQINAQYASAGTLGPASEAGVTGANGFTANFSGAQGSQASGGRLLGQISRDAGMNLNRLSPIQQQLNQQAQDQLGTNGGLTAQDLYNVQQDTRGAYAARGMYDSNQAIGAEILNSDAARRQRLLQNQQAAQSIDASGQQQIAANRGYALSAQGQGQNLSTFNTGQNNALSQFNAGQGNQTSQFNAGLLSDTSRFNAGASNTASLTNAAAKNQFGLAQFQQDAATSQYNSGLNYQMQLANAGLSQDAANAAWSRSNQYAGLLGQQSNDINNLVLGGTANSPQLGANTLGAGQNAQAQNTDLISGIYNYNANAANAANISAGNNSAATNGATIGAVGSAAGIAIMVF